MSGDSTTAVRDPFYEPLSKDAIANPYHFYSRLRKHSPVYWHRVLDSWVVTGYRECRQVLGDTINFGSDFRRVGLAIPDAQLSVQSLDPPEHGEIRRLLVAALHDQPQTLMTGQVATIAADQLSRLRDQGSPVDLVSQYARPVALRTVCAFLGVDPPDGAGFERLSNAIVRGMDSGLDPSRAEPANQARIELSRLVGDWLREAGDEGFLGAARRARRASGEVSDAVLANSMRAVLHAGYESVSRLLGNVLVRLVADPALLSDRTSPREVESLVDELIRLDGPVQADARVCVVDRLVGATPIRRGDVLVLFISAANRDPAAFPDPDSVSPTRRDRPNLSFGHGAHACLGARLAITQLRAVIDTLRGAGTRFTPLGPPVYEPTATLRGPQFLPVSLRHDGGEVPR